MDIQPEQVVRILYTNHRGQTAWREVLPLRVEFKATEWHPEPQWILQAFDLEKQAEPSFALKDVKRWALPISPEVKEKIRYLTEQADDAYQRYDLGFCAELRGEIEDLREGIT